MVSFGKVLFKRIHTAERPSEFQRKPPDHFPHKRTPTHGGCLVGRQNSILTRHSGLWHPGQSMMDNTLFYKLNGKHELTLVLIATIVAFRKNLQNTTAKRIKTTFSLALACEGLSIA